MMKREIKCPQCGHLTFYSPENPFRPFCSERCRLIDLGEWASESYKVSNTNNDTNEDDDEEIEPLRSENDEDSD